MKTIQQKDEKRHGRAQSDWQMKDAMTTKSITNSYINKAMRQSISELEKNGFTARRIRPFKKADGLPACEFLADFAKQTKTGLLVFSVRIDIGGNVTNPKP